MKDHEEVRFVTYFCACDCRGVRGISRWLCGNFPFSIKLDIHSHDEWCSIMQARGPDLIIQPPLPIKIPLRNGASQSPSNHETIDGLIQRVFTEISTTKDGPAKKSPLVAYRDIWTRIRKEKPKWEFDLFFHKSSSSSEILLSCSSVWRNNQRWF